MALNFMKIRSGMTLTPQASDPSGGQMGDFYYSSTTNTFRFYNGSVWQAVGSGTNGLTSTATSASTLTLTVNSTYQQYFTGTTAGQIVQMPVTSTLPMTGFSFLMFNESTQSITVNSSGGNLILSQAANTAVIYTCISLTGTTAASWFAQVIGAGGAITPTRQVLTSSSGTYTTPANVAWIQIRMVGGGGGGGTNAGATLNATAGGNTTFGTSFLTANGGHGGGNAGSPIAAGGTTSVGAGPLVLVSQTGADGGSTITVTSSVASYNAGGAGASSPFAGAGAGGSNSGSSSATGYGSGGGGGGTGLATGDAGGNGGAAGGYVEVIIPSPASTYAYSVGASGNGATGGAYGGGNGGAGVIIVEEYYNNGAIGTATNVTGIVAVANGGTGRSAALNSQVWASEGNGYGSSSTTVRRFVTTQINTGSDITYADSATLGGTFTINTAGIYSITYSDAGSGGASNMGITQNSASLSTNIQSITYANGFRGMVVTGGANFMGQANITLQCSVNDVIRAQTGTEPNLTTDTRMYLNIIRIQ